MDTSILEQLFVKLQDDFEILVANLEKSTDECKFESVFGQNVKSTRQEYNLLHTKFQNHLNLKEHDEVYVQKQLSIPHAQSSMLYTVCLSYNM